MTDKQITTVSVFVGLFTYATINSLLGPSILKIMEEFDVDFTFAGVVLSAFSMGVLTTVYTGRLADKYGSVTICRVGLLLMGLSAILIGLSENILFLYVFSFAFGVSSGLFEASFNQLILGLYPNSKGMMANITHSFYGFGSILGPIAATALITRFDDWRPGYILFGIMLLVNAIIQFFVKPKLQMSEEKRFVVESDNVDMRPLLLLLTASLLTFMLQMGINTWLPTYLVSEGRVDYIQSSFVLSSFWVAFALGRVFLGRIADIVGFKKVLVLSAAVQTVCSLSVIFVSGLMPNMIVWGVMGLMQAPYYPLIVTIAYNKYKNSSGKVMGRVVSSGFLGSLFVAPLIGTIADVVGANIATLLFTVVSASLLIVFLNSKIED